MKRTTILTMFEDQADGSFGFAHDNAIEKGFNAFYDGIGIFHDIFEHWFEGVHKHFCGDNEFNIGGEVAAMGAMAYYTSDMYISNRFMKRSNNQSSIQRIIGGTDGTIQDIIYSGRTEFAENGLITIPYQKPVESYILNNVINEHKVKLAEAKKDGYGSSYYDENEEEASKFFAESAQGWKLERLYRWGYKMAQKMVHNNDENNYCLEQFIEFWDKFCKNVDAKELANFVDKLEINVYTGENLRWNAFFITKEGKRVNVKYISDIEDFYSLYEEEDEY